MTVNLKAAAEKLKTGDYTCVFYDGADFQYSRERGIKPLIKILDNGKTLEEISAADKVVGRAAAFLYVLLGVRELYAEVISEGAVEVLKKFGIKYEYALLTKRIKNRAGDGFCPMETAVLDVSSPESALEVLKNRLG